jgi:hypothetical protein
MPTPLHADLIDIERHASYPKWGDSRLPERFWDKTAPCPMSGCWLWTASWTVHDYGHCSRKEDGVWRSRVAHKVAYEALVGPVPTGLVLDHLCRVRPCCNPLHLEAVTQRENVLRGAGLAAANALKTSCPAGHSYADSGVYVYPNGKRKCRVCTRAQLDSHRARVAGGAQ